MRIVITAGPTVERIDPVRYLSNFSTGSMGYEIAKQAKNRKYKVVLISAVVNIKAPKGVELINIISAEDMQKALLNTLKKDDILIMSAAVADFKAKKIFVNKIKKGSKLTLELVKTPDILKSLNKKRIKYKVGFALESEDLLINANKKLVQKNLDMIVANEISAERSPFGYGNNDFIVITKDKTPHFYRNMSRKKIAAAILDTIEGNVL